MPYPCFWLEPTPRARVYLRRYSRDHDWQHPLCPVNGPFHEARVRIEDGPLHVDAEGYQYEVPAPRDDPRWAAACACGYLFTEADPWQLFEDRVYVRADNGTETTLRDAPAGALWDAWWLHHQTPNCQRGADGISLKCKTPGGDWLVDGQARNCTMPDDHCQQRHHCWVRHGDPRHPATLHVDKNGPTCGAGAGSIQCGSYHGFLHAGALTEG